MQYWIIRRNDGAELQLSLSFPHFGVDGTQFTMRARAEDYLVKVRSAGCKCRLVRIRRLPAKVVKLERELLNAALAYEANGLRSGQWVLSVARAYAKAVKGG